MRACAPSARPLRTAKKGCETPDGGCQIEVGGTREVQVCRGPQASRAQEREK